MRKMYILITILSAVFSIMGCKENENCTGSVTPDLIANNGECNGEWIHGEQLCPQQSWCGYALACMAYSDWIDAKCNCAESNNICCPIAFDDLEEGTVLRTIDDINNDQNGIQYPIRINIGCWMDGNWSVTIAECGDGDSDNLKSSMDEHGNVSTIITFEGNGVFEICATISMGGNIITNTPIQISVE